MKRRNTDPTNTNTVAVLDAEGRPLMPTRPSRARRLMRDGRAEEDVGQGRVRHTDEGR